MELEQQREQATKKSAIGKIDEKCIAVSQCMTNTKDHRKIVSHIFGRNKSQTKQIPEECFPMYCRKHYQRFKFRCGNNGTWVFVQIDLVRKQLQKMEQWGRVVSWKVVLHKQQQKQLDAANAALAKIAEKVALAKEAALTKEAALAKKAPQPIETPAPRPNMMRIASLLHNGSPGTGSSGSQPSSSIGQPSSSDGQPSSNGREETVSAESNDDIPYLDDTDDTDPGSDDLQYLRILIPYLGDGKSFEEVRHIINLINTQAQNTPEDDAKGRSFPAIEFLPNIDPGRSSPYQTARTSSASSRSDSVAHSSTSPEYKKSKAAPRAPKPSSSSDPKGFSSPSDSDKNPTLRSHKRQNREVAEADEDETEHSSQTKRRRLVLGLNRLNIVEDSNRG